MANTNDYLAQLMARAEKKLTGTQTEGEVSFEKAEPADVSSVKTHTAAQADSILDEILKKTSEDIDIAPQAQSTAPAPAAEEIPAAVSSPKEEKTTVPVADVAAERSSHLKDEVSDLYTSSFTDDIPSDLLSKEEKRRHNQNRKALMDKQSGKKGSFFKFLFDVIGFLFIVALTICAVMLLLQFIAGIEIVNLSGIWEEITHWFSELFG